MVCVIIFLALCSSHINRDQVNTHWGFIWSRNKDLRSY